MRLIKLQDVLLYMYLQLIESIKRGDKKYIVQLPSAYDLLQKVAEKKPFEVEAKYDR